MHRLADAIKLSVKDNGVGFSLDDEKLASYGLKSMKERVNEIGGSLNIITAPGKGTRIEIRVPVLESEESEGGIRHGREHDGRDNQSVARG